MSAFIRRLAAGSVAVATTITLAGCATVEGTPYRAGAAPITETSTDGPVATGDPARVHDLVLDAAAFPTGYDVLEVPRENVQELIDQMLQATREAEVTPASCLQLSLIPASMDVTQIGLVVATRGTDSLGEAIGVSGATIDQQRQSIAGECANIRMRMDVGMGITDATVQQREVPAPATKASADQLIVIDQTTSFSMAGQDVTSRTRLGYALINGYTVSVSASSPTGGPIDDAGFERVLVQAVNKVVDET